jgi:hypothetical protein
MSADNPSARLRAAFPPRRRASEHTPRWIWPVYGVLIALVVGYVAV